MKRVQRASGLFFFVMIGCGGSSSESPMPLEPVPHSGPEPVVSSQKSTPVDVDDAEERAGDDELEERVPLEDTATQTSAAPEQDSPDSPVEEESEELETPTDSSEGE